MEIIEKEKRLVNELKTIMDSDANFVKPFSEFWKDCSPEQAPGAYGLYRSLVIW